MGWAQLTAEGPLRAVLGCGAVCRRGAPREAPNQSLGCKGGGRCHLGKWDRVAGSGTEMALPCGRSVTGACEERGL